MAVLMAALSVTVLEIIAVEMCMTLTLNFKKTKVNIYTAIERSYVTSYLMTTVMLTLHVTILEIFAVNTCITLTMIYRIVKEEMKLL